jgi:hypothetical protein
MSETPEHPQTTPRLTQPQRKLLVKTGDRPQSVIADYAPAKRLIALGLVTPAFGKFRRVTLTITEAGRAALS